MASVEAAAASSWVLPQGPASPSPSIPPSPHLSSGGGRRVRRKRTSSNSAECDDDSVLPYHDDGTSWTSNGGAGASEVDSLQPVVPPKKKKRRRHLLDAMASINLRHKASEDEQHPNTIQHSTDDEDADSSQAVADDDEEADAYSINSSLDDDDDDIDIEDEEEDGENGTLRPSSGQQQAQRKFLFELVFGPEKPQSVVDLRLEELIRRSIRESVAPPAAAPHSQDDMSIDGCSYCRPSVPLQRAPFRIRSNSLPHAGTARDSSPSDEDMEVDDNDL